MQFLKSLHKKAKSHNDPEWHTLPGNLLSRLFTGKEGTVRQVPPTAGWSVQEAADLQRCREEKKKETGKLCKQRSKQAEVLKLPGAV